jgi:hypothetical protein
MKIRGKRMSDLGTWLNKCFNVTGSTGDELQFNCPKCDHPSFFFNLLKKIGYCHRASCHWTPSIQDLNRYTRTKFGNTVTQEYVPVERPSQVKIEMPESDPLVELRDGIYLTRFPNAIKGLEVRNLSVAKIYQYGLRFNGIRVYVPVFYEGKLVNYVGRRAFWKDKELEHAGVPKYEYCTGAQTSHYLFNWDAARLWPRLTFTENTFNAMWLSDVCHGSTNFGSHISATQLELLRMSKAKSVVLLWDEGAEDRAGVCVERMRKLGIPSIYVALAGQPDNHPVEKLVEWVTKAHERATLRELCLKVR